LSASALGTIAAKSVAAWVFAYNYVLLKEIGMPKNRKNNRLVTGALAATLLLGAVVAQAADWKFAVTCDSRSSYFNDTFAGKENYANTATNISPYFKNVADALAAHSAGLDLILFPGDLAAGKKLGPVSHNASTSEFQNDLNAWNTMWQPVINTGIPVYAVRGNHETTSLALSAGNSVGADIWRNTIALPAGTTVDTNGAGTVGDQHGLSYSFTHKGARFIGLDEYDNGTAGSTSYDKAFLTQELAKPATRRFVFAHQPVFAWKTDELGPSGLAADLNNGRADLYMSGHIHSYQRLSKDGIRFQEMIVGTGGAPQDDPTLNGQNGYPVDNSLHLLGTKGGAVLNAVFGWAEITVHDDNTFTTEYKYLGGSFGDVSTNYKFTPDGTILTADAADVTAAFTDISASAGTKTSGFVYNRSTQSYSGTLTVTNSSAASIDGTVAVALNGLPAGVTLSNATGIYGGAPFVAQLVSLAPGASVTFPVKFSNPSNQRINFTPGAFFE
jgi:hypothetical protein